MNRTLLYAIVIMVFGFLILRYKFMPLLSSCRARKGTGTGNAPASPAGISPAVQTAAPFLSFPALCQPQGAPLPQECRRMYFDYRIISAAGNTAVPEASAAFIKAVSLEADQMLADLHKRGVMPADLKILRIAEEYIMVYTVYVL